LIKKLTAYFSPFVLVPDYRLLAVKGLNMAQKTDKDVRILVVDDDQQLADMLVEWAIKPRQLMTAARG
jgi:hypothetical protein